MARLRQRLRSLYDRIPDWLWPHLTGEPVPAPDGQRLAETCDASLLDAMERAVERRVSQVDERLRTVEGKLAALLTLTSILSAVVTAGFAAALTLKLDTGLSSVPVWAGFAIVVYLGVNLLLSLRATVRGLIRRGYGEIAYTDLVPRIVEDQMAYRARILSEQLANAEWNDWVLDQKVSELAVAHVALQNALSATGGIILITVLGTVLRSI